MNDVNSIETRKVLYLKIPVANADGTIDLGAESFDGSLDIETVISAAIDEVEEHGGDVYVYECIPVRRIVRGKTRVQVLRRK